MSLKKSSGWGHYGDIHWSDHTAVVLSALCNRRTGERKRRWRGGCHTSPAHGSAPFVRPLAPPPPPPSPVGGQQASRLPQEWLHPAAEQSAWISVWSRSGAACRWTRGWWPPLLGGTLGRCARWQSPRRDSQNGGEFRVNSVVGMTPVQ